MQTSTGKELAERKDELRALLKEALAHHDHCEAARSSVANAQELALWHGWQAGIRLNEMKALVPTGDWEDWVELNFCKPRKITIRTAQIYMKIDNDNAVLRDKAKTKRVSPARLDFELLRKLKFDTIRKHAIGFVPEKTQVSHRGNKNFSRLVSFTNIANEYERLMQRHIEGIEEVDFDEAAEDTRPMVPMFLWLHRDLVAELLDLTSDQRSRIARNPWDAKE